ncbi:MAG TPA: cob(I)yrinic acid a,c-diamide adenosyltransferase [Syntrophorhabdaceae bacterium]|nr:cob(I)yrinic acid a,c-diamide adenosyltransferase [Syntrophorhabdaceae bacterium]
MRKGYIQVYTGNGKGKTTAALGLAFRAAGAGLKVFIGQFVKKKVCSEHRALARFADLITVKQYGTGFLSGESPPEAAVRAAMRGIREVRDLMVKGGHDVIILDELSVALHYKLLTLDSVIGIIDAKPPHVELVITGRYANDEVIKRADLVTEMSQIKHYYQANVKARKGIEY